MQSDQVDTVVLGNSSQKTVRESYKTCLPIAMHIRLEVYGTLPLNFQ